MTEKLNRLQETLTELHEELESLDSVDESTGRLLRGAMQDIQSSLERRDTEALQEPSIGDRLAESARGFEQSHPTLSRLIGNILDALSGIGI